VESVKQIQEPVLEETTGHTCRNLVHGVII